MESQVDQDSIHSLVRKAENDYVEGNVQLGKYVEFSMYENIEKIDAYLNSKHISGDKDSLEREKPFFNIVTAAVNIWYRATDLDRKNLRFKSTKNTKTEWLKSFWATAELKEWMRRERFGAFLNDWGRALARYGSVVVKFIEKDGKLNASVIPWNRLIVDAVEFEPNAKVEVLWLTPSQLRKNKNYDQDQVEALIETVTARETLNKEKKDSKSEYIKLYEVHGELPLSYLTGKDEDCKEYVQQMHVISFVAGKSKKGSKKVDWEDFSLYKGRESKDPYMITHLIKEDGRTQSIGAVEHLFEAQWMTNHTAKAIKDHLDLASKLIFQTSDGSYVGRNALTAIEQGDILIHKMGEPLTQINNGSHDISSLQAYSQQWQALAQDLTSTPDAIRGATQPSGTAWRQVEALRTESHSLFEIMRENKALHVEDMLRLYIIPYLKKQIKKKHSLVAELTKEDADKLDEAYANVLLAEQLEQINAAGQFADPMQIMMATEEAKEKMSQGGLVREQEITSDLYDDFEWEVEFDITNEAMDTDAILTTLSTVFTTIASNPMILQEPNIRMIFNKILEETGAVSPIEFSNNTQAPMATSMTGVQGAQPGMAPMGVSPESVKEEINFAA